MTAAQPARRAGVVDVCASDPRRARRLRDGLRGAGTDAECAARGRGRGGDVAVAAGRSVEDALGAAPAGWWFDGTRLVVVADDVRPDAVRHATGLGVRVVLRSGPRVAGQLADAVRTARDGLARVPVTALPGAGRPARTGAPARLTARQVQVVALMAEGRSNAEIAGALACSPHTVRHVVHELMGRLVARTRAQAVAHAVRSGLI